MPGTEQSMGGAGRLSLTTTTAIMVATVIAFFLLFVLAFFLYLRAKRYWGAIPVSGAARLASAAELAVSPAPQQRGLDAAAVAALPSLAFAAGDVKEGLECAVCLCELSAGDAARLLPRCGHAFHLECIGMWFCSHSTCPLCRSSMEVEEPGKGDSGAELVASNARPVEPSPDFAANVLLCAAEDHASGGSSCWPEGSSSTSSSNCGRSEDVLVIEIPRRAVDGFQTPGSPLPVSRLPEEEIRSPAAPTLRSLRRLLILGSRMAGASCSPRGCDMEQGCPPVPKTPTTS